MRIMGLEISRASATEKALAPVSSARSGWFSILEAAPGNWQSNVEVNADSVLSFHAVYSCITLIASDIAKLRVKLVEQDDDGIWTEIASSAFSPVLRKPNGFQNRIQFWENWFLSKLTTGNTYVLKQRDARQVVERLYVLDPRRVTPLLTEDGDVYYDLSADNIAGLTGRLIVPASEIIHDRMNCLFHPLVGTSPIFAAGVAATQGLRIQDNSATFFGNQSKPGGILTAPGAISEATAQRLKTYFDTNFSGSNAGRIAVAGDGLKFEPFTISAHDSQLIEQLKWTAEVVCGVFHVPPYKVNVGQMPTYNNIQSLNVEYYSQCLQRLIEDAELCLDEGLGMGMGVTVGGRVIGTEFDVDNLLRMDSVTQMDVLEKAKSLMTLNERRKRLDQKGIEGGDTVYLQQQDHSIAAIAARDAMLIEQSRQPVVAPVVPAEPVPAPEPDDTERAVAAWRMKCGEALHVA